MTLKECKKGREYIVENVEKSNLVQPSKRRLEALGLIEGTMIHKINEALDGSIIFMVRGSRLAIGKDLAEDIAVREVTKEDRMNRRRGRGRRRGCCGKSKVRGLKSAGKEAI